MNLVPSGVWEGRDKGMPNSRLVRQIMAPDADRWQKDTTMLLMQFGQFVDHDITHVPTFQFGNWNFGVCCYGF